MFEAAYVMGNSPNRSIERDAGALYVRAYVFALFGITLRALYPCGLLPPGGMCIGTEPPPAEPVERRLEAGSQTCET